MQARPAIQKPRLAEIATLLRGEVEPISRWSERWETRRFVLQVAVIIAGAGCYGAAMGWWRDPHQALITAIKFPVIILLTTAGNALINGMLAPLLGLNIPFRQSLAAIFMSLTIAAAILGAFSPLIAFLTWNAPPMSKQAVFGPAYSLIKLAHVAVIAFAGTAGNARLFQLLTRLAGNRAVAFRVLFAWLAGNLFLGSQLAWILRPFIGSPVLPVEFFRATALHGNFYENVFRSILQIFNG
ncbi:MAG: hypothetical protein ABSH48_20580 [Verrucomicrobiota bacterium]|jgi:hypothetical protein